MPSQRHPRDLYAIRCSQCGLVFQGSDLYAPNREDLGFTTYGAYLGDGRWTSSCPACDSDLGIAEPVAEGAEDINV